MTATIKENNSKYELCKRADSYIFFPKSTVRKKCTRNRRSWFFYFKSLDCFRDLPYCITHVWTKDIRFFKITKCAVDLQYKRLKKINRIEMEQTSTSEKLILVGPDRPTICKIYTLKRITFPRPYISLQSPNNTQIDLSWRYTGNCIYLCLVCR